MKKVLFAALCCLMVAAVSCKKQSEPTPQPKPQPEPQPIPAVVEVTGITVSPATLALNVGATGWLNVKVTPEDASDKTVLWSSSAEGVATVADGLVTAVAPGEAVITAKAGEKTATCVVTVAEEVIAVTGISLDITSLELIIGEKAELVATVEPEDATDKTITWTSTAENVATVENGIVTAVDLGEAVIIAAAGAWEAACSVKVSAPAPPAPTVKALQYEELPSMLVPRMGHACFATADGDIVAVGGHTYSFYLTDTAERLHDGQWEALSISNPHDGAAYVTLPDGRVLICGGFSSGMGVGQSTVCDIYDPSTHTFSPAANLTEYRAYCVGVLTGIDNHVLVSGNWYNSDSSFELWDGSSWSSLGMKEMYMHLPFIVSDGNGIVYVLGCYSTYGGFQGLTVYKVDTVNGSVETLENTGMEDYLPWYGTGGVEPAACTTQEGALLFIGKSEEYNSPYALMSFDPATAKGSKLADLPMEIEDVNMTLSYSPGVLVNKNRGEAYVVGYYGNSGQVSLVVINYNLATGEQIIYHGGVFENNFASGSRTIHPASGKIIITGGSISDNFDIQNPAISVTPFE